MAFAKKSLGQHFLISKQVVTTMVKKACVEKTDVVLEIGPGKGILTEALLATGARVISFEKDDLLIPLLKERFKKEIREERLTLIHGDILEIKNWSKEDWKKNVGEKYKVVANIPYYITGLLLPLFLETPVQPKTVAFLVQKEVAERVLAKNKKESILSISIKCYGTPHYAGKVKKTLFRPMPKVDSAILLITDISKKFFDSFSEEAFFNVVKKGFAHKRKLLKGNLNITEDVLLTCGLEKNSRAEDLELNDWKCLLKKLR